MKSFVFLRERASQSGVFIPRFLLAFTLFSVGVALGMFSLAATPPIDATLANAGVQPDPTNLLSVSGGNANRFPPGVPFPRSGLNALQSGQPGVQFPAGRQGGALISSPTAGLPGMPPRPRLMRDANSPANPVLGKQQRTLASVQQLAASQSAPLTPGTQNTWSIVTSPNTVSQTNYLNGVACASATDCWAVGGYYTDSGDTQTLVERSDGNSWSIVPSPNPGAGLYPALQAVACTSASDCWALGYAYSYYLPIQAFAEHWDGSLWSIVMPQSISGKDAYLVGLSCVSASDCWAVGYSAVFDPFPAPFWQTLIEHWDGTSWTIVPSPNFPDPENEMLQGVNCTSASDCWAVGYWWNGTEVAYWQTLTEHWDGTSWSIAPSGNIGPANVNQLFGVACPSATDCWAVGDTMPLLNAGKTLIANGNGILWSSVTSPDTSQNDWLLSVACAASSKCWAVGVSSSSCCYPSWYGDPIIATYILGWDGTSWTIAPSPNTRAPQNVLLSVACVSGSDCWAAGYSYDYSTGVGQTLIEHYGLPFVQLNAVVSSKTHGNAGTFNVNLPLTGTPGVECRTPGNLPGGATGDYQLIFTFANGLSSVGGASVTSGTGSVASSNIDSSDAHNYIVNLTGVTNAQVITVSLSNVNDSAGNSSSILSATMGVLLGDVNANRLVDGNDVSAVQSQTRQPVSNTNFRFDVNASGGVIDGNDVSITQSQTRTSLP